METSDKFKIGSPAELVASKSKVFSLASLGKDNKEPLLGEPQKMPGGELMIPHEVEILGGIKNLDEANFLPKHNGGTLDTLTMPELVMVANTDNPSVVEFATRSLVQGLVGIDRDTFAIDFRAQTQAFILTLRGQRVSLDRRGQLTGEMSKVIDDSIKEMTAVSQLLYWSNLFNKAGRSVDKIAGAFSEMAEDTMITPGMFNVLFNLKSVDATRLVSGRHLGNDIDIVLRACMVAGMSEDKTALVDLMSRPGFALMFENGLEGTYRDKVIEYIGHPNSTGWQSDRVVDKEGSLSQENALGVRGRLTKYGNIWARTESSDDYFAFRETLKELVGGNELAVDLGLAVFKVFGMDADNAAIVGLNGDGKKTIQLEGWPQSSDLAKLMHFMAWQVKQDIPGHPCGPKETRGRIKRLLLPFIKATSFGVNVAGTGDLQTRSLYEQVWGYANEPAKRFGEIEWGKLSGKVWLDWGTKISVPTGSDGGLFNLLKSEKIPADIATVGFWEFFTLNLNVVVNDALMSGGEFAKYSPQQLKEMVKQEKKRIIDIYWAGIQSLPDFHIWNARAAVPRNPDRIGSQTNKWAKQYVIEVAQQAGVTLTNNEKRQTNFLSKIFGWIRG